MKRNRIKTLFAHCCWLVECVHVLPLLKQTKKIKMERNVWLSRKCKRFSPEPWMIEKSEKKPRLGAIRTDWVVKIHVWRNGNIPVTLPIINLCKKYMQTSDRHRTVKIKRP